MSINRREFIGSAIAGATVLSLSELADAQTGKKKKRPNIIIFMGDDLGYCDTELYCKGPVPTPNVNAIAKNGVSFTDGYVTAPVCSPSRAALLTGRYQHRFGFEFNAGPLQRAMDNKEMGLPTNEVTIADVLKKAGYKTGMVGKWHLGLHPKFHPQSRGFDEYFGFLFGQNSYITEKTPDGVSDKEVDARFSQARTDRNPILRARDIVEENEHLTDAFAREAIGFIDRHKSDKEPFFLYMPFNAPHEPIQTVKKYYDRFPAIKDEKKRIYASMVSAMDDAIGSVVAKLQKENLEKDTVIIFLSDNGCATYTNACVNDPLKAGKLTPFEGGVRIPYAIQWKSGIKGGQTFKKPVSTLDIFPTFAAIAGIELPKDREYDGVNLLPYMTGKKKDTPNDFLFWRNGENGGIRHENWKLVKINSHYLLYDLSKDVSEAKNWANEKKDVVVMMQAAWANWEKKTIAPMWEGRDAGFSVTYDGITMKIIV